MSAPLDFLRILAERLRLAGIRFAITSGMACVHYGLQQTTKDSDWVILPEDFIRFRELLADLEREPRWRVSYRPIFGAPLESSFMMHGWTSHLLITEPDGSEQKVDLFGKPPRVRELTNDPDDPDFASREVVAQMKKTDRPRDWPMVDSLGWQSVTRSKNEAMVHLQDAVKLLSVWAQADQAQRAVAKARRPLLGLLETDNDPDRLDGFLRIERLIWECVNNERYSIYARAWKDFYRAWQKQADFVWPLEAPFAQQHEWVKSAARRLNLPPDPLGDVGREDILRKALARAKVKGMTSLENLSLVQPPLTELLP